MMIVEWFHLLGWEINGFGVKNGKNEIVSDSSQNYRVYSVFYGGHEYGIGFWIARSHLFEKLTQRCRNLVDFGSQNSKFPRIPDISRRTSRLPGASSARP